MELSILIQKIRDGATLSQEEREHLLILLDTELRQMREKDPKAYLDLLNLLMDAVKRASKNIAALASYSVSPSKP
jgi:hypothetical protein